MIGTDQFCRWYVGVLKPGASHKAPPRRGIPDEFNDEAVVERSLREAGLEGYLPRMKMEIYLRRSRKSVVRRFPLFTGYVFVAQPRRLDGSFAPMPWDVLGACDGIHSFLRNDGWAVVVPAGYVEKMQAAQNAGLFDKMIEPVVKGRARKKTAAERFPPGSSVRPKAGPFAGFNGLVEDVTAQGLIKVAIEIFGRGTPVEFEARQLEAV